MNVNLDDELLKEFVQKVSGRIGKEASLSEELGCYQIDSDSWSTLAVKMHHYFFITRDDEATAADFDAYIKKCVDWGLKNYRGIPRGLQKGVAIYPVLLQKQASNEVVACTKQKPDSHWAAFVLPTAVDLTTGAVEYLEKTPVWGFAMWKGIRKAAEETLG